MTDTDGCASLRFHTSHHPTPYLDGVRIQARRRFLARECARGESDSQGANVLRGRFRLGYYLACPGPITAVEGESNRTRSDTAELPTRKEVSTRA